jgi:hypothetical protein
MTKLIFLTVDGRARIENTKIGTRLIEMPDGYHPLTNDSVWQDAERMRPPAIVLIQGVLGGYGSNMTREDVLTTLYEIELAERAFRPASVSKMWMRALARMIEFMMKWGIWILVGLVVLIYYASGAT